MAAPDVNASTVSPATDASTPRMDPETLTPRMDPETLTHVRFPIVNWYLNSYLVAVQPKLFHDFINLHVLDCPENTMLLFVYQDKTLQFEKKADRFECKGKSEGSLDVMPFAHAVQGDTCFFTRQELHQALAHTYPDPENMPACMVKMKQSKYTQFWIEPEPDVEEFIAENLHFGHLYGYLSKKPSRITLVVQDMYSLLTGERLKKGLLLFKKGSTDDYSALSSDSD